MPRIFTFGIPNYFNFTFRPGPAAVELSDRTVAVELDPNTNADAGATDEVKVISPSSRDDTGSIAVLPCGSLSKLPLEVRTMIYRKVLRFEKPIRHAHNFLDPHPPFMLAESSHIEEINAAILRTCRTIYQEAIHILYGTNRFYFRKSKDIEKFAFRGLSNISFGIYCSQHPYIAENITYGRLTMIRFLHLRIGRKSTGDDRKEIWSSWSNFFYPSEKSSEEQGQLVGFPALERLVLDFTDLDLDDRDTSRVRVSCQFMSYLKSLTTILFPHYAKPFSHSLCVGWLSNPVVPTRCLTRTTSDSWVLRRA